MPDWHPAHPDPGHADRLTLSLDGGPMVTILLEEQDGRVVGTIDVPPGVRFRIVRAGDRAAVIWLNRDRRPAVPTVLPTRKRKTPSDLRREERRARPPAIVPGAAPRPGPPIQRRASKGGVA